MAIGFPAMRSAEFFVSEASEPTINEVKSYVQEVLNNIDGTDVKCEGNTISCRLRWSFWSWGESFKVQVNSANSMTVHSKSFQLFDWGVNRTNIYQFSSSLAQYCRHKVVLKKGFLTRN